MPNINIKLQSIARQQIDSSVMEELFATTVTVGEGLKGDNSDSSKAGEVTVLSKESWVKICHEAETEMPWLASGANLLVKGFEFLPTDLGKTLLIGEVVLEITRATDPGYHLEKDAPHVVDALKLGWRGGVVCKVLRSGEIQSGDSVNIAE